MSRRSPREVIEKNPARYGYVQRICSEFHSKGDLLLAEIEPSLFEALRFVAQEQAEPFGALYTLQILGVVGEHGGDEFYAELFVQTRQIAGEISAANDGKHKRRPH